MSYLRYARYARAGMGLYSQYRRTFRPRRRRPTRRSTVYARTYRRGPSNRYRRGYQSRAGIKRVNTNRKRVGLSNLELKKHLVFHADSQWNAYSSSTWSFIEALHTIPIGTTKETRTSDKIKCLPNKKFTLNLEQVASTEHDYRILLVKKTSKDNVGPTPLQLLANNAYPTLSGYKFKDAKSNVDPDFIVLKDIKFRWNTDPAKSTTLKKINLSIPGANLVYDDGIAAGYYNENSIYLFVYTSAPDNTAGYTISMYEYMKFLDQ